MDTYLLLLLLLCQWPGFTMTMMNILCGEHSEYTLYSIVGQLAFSTYTPRVTVFIVYRISSLSRVTLM